MIPIAIEVTEDVVGTDLSYCECSVGIEGNTWSQYVVWDAIDDLSSQDRVEKLRLKYVLLTAGEAFTEHYEQALEDGFLEFGFDGTPRGGSISMSYTAKFYLIPSDLFGSGGLMICAKDFLPCIGYKPGKTKAAYEK